MSSNKEDSDKKPLVLSDVDVAVRKAVLEDAIHAIEDKVHHFEAEGLRKSNFTVGVVNLAASAFIIGKWPQWYWVAYLFKAIFLVFCKVTFFWYPKKQHYYFLDFCWISNGGIFVTLVLILSNVLTIEASQIVWKIFFAIANGPLAWSVIALSNKLVFHSFDWTSTLFIHFSPMVATWGIHWFPHKAEWGDRFEGTGLCNAAEKTGDCTSSVYGGAHQELTVIALGMTWYMIWWFFFTAWMHLRGINYPKMTPAYDTVFEALKPLFVNTAVMKGKSERTQLTLYMVGHAAACLAALMWSGLCWNNMIAHTLFIIFAFTCATVQGSSWYLYAMQKASIKQVKSLMKKHEKKA